MSATFVRRALALLAGVGLPVGAVALTGTTASASGARTGTIYTLSNEASGNRVLAYATSADGSLTSAGSTPTGGLGSGSGLGSQGALVVTGDHRHLLAVNAGSSSVSELAITRNGDLRVVSSAPSGGPSPISIAVHGQTVYVLNADDTISGLRLDDGLTPIVGSTRHLSGAGGAQVSFTPNGRQLVVTEKGTNTIEVFSVDDGAIGSATTTASTGATPFGFAFGNRGHLLVSNAAGGAPQGSSLTSYRVNRAGSAVVLDGPAATNQTAACWVVVTPDGRYAYTTNTGSGTITGYRVAADGDLRLLDVSGVTATVGSGPIDATIADGTLYTVNARSHTITFNHVAANGSLGATGSLGGLPASDVGIAAA